MLKSKEGITNTEFKFKVLVRDKGPSPITEAEILLSIEIVLCADDFNDETFLESKVNIICCT